MFKSGNQKNIAMKKSISFIVVAFIGFALQAQTLRTVNNTAFKRGESLRYKVYYDAILTGKVNAGEAELDVKNEDKLNYCTMFNPTKKNFMCSTLRVQIKWTHNF